MAAFLLLLLAIAVEVVATAALPRAQGFTDLRWSLFVVAGYVLSIWLLTVVVRWLEVSVVYAIWSGVGTAAIAVIGYLWLGESLGPFKVIGIALIVGGVVLLNLQGAAH